MQIRHVHARVHRTLFLGLHRQVVDVRDSDSVPGGRADDRSHRHPFESDGVATIFIHGIKREGYNMIVCPRLG